MLLKMKNDIKHKFSFIGKEKNRSDCKKLENMIKIIFTKVRKYLLETVCRYDFQSIKMVTSEIFEKTFGNIGKSISS